MQTRSFANFLNPRSQAALIKHFSTTKAAVTQMDIDLAQDPLNSQQGVDENYRSFVDAQDLGLEATIKSIGHLAKQDLTYEEFSEYMPMADELVMHLEDHMYALTYEQRMDKISKMKPADLMALLEFGIQFNIGGHEYWSLILDLASNQNILKKMKPLDAIEVMNNLKDYGLLKASLTLKICQQVEGQIGKMDAETLSIYLLIFASDHTKDAYKSARQLEEYQKQHEKIAERLQTLVTKLDSEKLGMLMTGIDTDFKYDAFLTKAVKQVEKFLKDNSLDLEYLPYVMSCYGGANVEGAADLILKLENYALDNFQELTAQQAANLIIMNGDIIESAELVEICEKVIAANIDSLQNETHGGSSLLLEVLQGFQNSSHTRPKMLELLVARLAKDFADLSIPDQCEFVRTLYYIEDEAAEQAVAS